MDSQLIQALTERIKAGHTKSQIREEMMTVGYDEAAFEAAYQKASGEERVETEIPAPASVLNLLPAYTTLAKDALTVALSQIPLLLKTILAFVVICLSAALLIQMSGSVLVSGVGSSWLILGLISLIIFVGLIALVGIVGVLSTILRVLLKRKESVRYRDGLFWSGTHVVAISLVSVYVQVLTQVGYMLLVIPGLMLSMYLLFSMFFVISGKEKGIAALTASTALVYGRFWPVSLRILFSVGIILLAVVATVLVAGLTAFLPPVLEAMFVILIILAVLFASFWQLCFTLVLFESLERLPAAKPLPIALPKLQTIYRTVVVIVLTLLIFVTALIGFGATTAYQHGYFTGEWTETSLKTDVMQKQLLALSLKNAESLYLANGSYEYVCDELGLPDDVSCKNSGEGVALEAPLNEGLYCVDSSGFKEVVRRSVITEEGSCGEEGE